MNYQQQIEMFSNEVFSLKFGDSAAKLSFLTESTQKNIDVYKRNLILGAVSRFSQDYPGLKAYLSEDNFNYFCKQILLEQPINTPNISEYMKFMPWFLRQKQDVHDDPLVPQIADIDYLWSFGEKLQSVTVATGLLYYWQELQKAESSDRKIYLDTEEVVFVDEEVGGDKVLAVHTGVYKS